MNFNEWSEVVWNGIPNKEMVSIDPRVRAIEMKKWWTCPIPSSFEADTEEEWESIEKKFVECMDEYKGWAKEEMDDLESSIQKKGLKSSLSWDSDWDNGFVTVYATFPYKDNPDTNQLIEGILSIF